MHVISFTQSLVILLRGPFTPVLKLRCQMSSPSQLLRILSSPRLQKLLQTPSRPPSPNRLVTVSHAATTPSSVLFFLPSLSASIWNFDQVSLRSLTGDRQASPPPSPSSPGASLPQSLVALTSFSVELAKTLPVDYVPVSCSNYYISFHVCQCGIPSPRTTNTSSFRGTNLCSSRSCAGGLLPLATART